MPKADTTGTNPTSNSTATDSNGSALILSSRQVLSKDLRSLLESEGWQTIVTNSFGPARRLLNRGDVSLLLLDTEDLKSPADEITKALRDADDVPLILISGSDGSNREVIRGMEPGAILDYPLQPVQLRNALNAVNQRRSAEQQTEILGRSDAMREIRGIVAQIASAQVNVLITGETGTGKSHVAEAIHKSSTRTGQAFLNVNCGAIPETLLESELFGHEKGAFTDARSQRQGIFEAADGGTVFLDEIGEMSLPAQVRLLRVLEAKEITRLGSTRPLKVDVRLIAATNLDLLQAIREGRFRSDLYYRLKVIEIRIPALRKRPEDIPALIDRFVSEYSQTHEVPPVQIQAEAIRLLERHDWPGNIRELKNLIERMMVLSPNREVGPEDVAGMLQDLSLLEGRTAETTSNLPVHLGKTPEESYRDLLYWAVLEVARDVKELKSIILNQRPPFQSLPPYGPAFSPVAGEAEVEFSETENSLPEGAIGEAVHEIQPLEEVEREAIARALAATGGHRKRAAKLLQMPERTLYRKIRQFNL